MIKEVEPEMITAATAEITIENKGVMEVETDPSKTATTENNNNKEEVMEVKIEWNSNWQRKTYEKVKEVKIDQSTTATTGNNNNKNEVMEVKMELS